MNETKVLLFVVVAILISSISFAQSAEKNKASYIESKNEFYKKILKDLDEFYHQQEDKKEPSQSFKMNFDGVDIPKSVDEFEIFWHNSPISQGSTGMCWDYSTTSFFESEIYRLRGEEIKLSELHTAYCILHTGNLLKKHDALLKREEIHISPKALREKL